MCVCLGAFLLISFSFFFSFLVNYFQVLTPSRSPRVLYVNKKHFRMDGGWAGSELIGNLRLLRFKKTLLFSLL